MASSLYKWCFLGEGCFKCVVGLYSNCDMKMCVWNGLLIKYLKQTNTNTGFANRLKREAGKPGLNNKEG